MKKNSNKFLLFSISIGFVFITGIILACADFGYEDFYNSFFAPETSNALSYKPFYRSGNKFYGDERFESTLNSFDDVNISEWSQFFDSKVTATDLKYLVYQCRIGEIDTLIFYLKDNKFPTKAYLKKNSIILIADKPLAKECLFYLGYAKRCEPFATYSPDWWDDNAKEKDPRNSTAPMMRLIVGGAKALAGVKSDFVRERYIFQMTRLYYNSRQFENCISYYESHADVFTVGNSMKYRAMGYAAGAYYKLGKYSEANYLYSLLYDQCKEMKLTAFLSFHPQDDSDWNEALKLARNNREKTVLWHLLGIYADPLRAMKQIYALDPTSELLDLLLVRVVNISEESFISPQFYNSPKDSFASTKISLPDSELISFLKEVADKKNTNKPYLWDLSTGYLFLAQKDFKLADKYLKSAEKEAIGDKLVGEQIRSLRLIAKVEQYVKPSEKAETEFAKELLWLDKEKHEEGLRSSSIYQWALMRLSQRYRSFGDFIKAQCLDISQDVNFYNSSLKINALINLMDKPVKSEFEKLMLRVHPYSKIDLYEYQSINLLYQYKFREALAKLEECKGAGEKILLGDPFLIHINDCHDCDHALVSDTVYTLCSFIKRLIELETSGSSDPKKVARKYFLLANGLYNMTYFGNARLVYETPIKSSSVQDFEYYTTPQQLTDAIYNCNKAGEYYVKAMELSTDKEFKAKCCFMAAKCEQNAYFTSTEFDYQRIIRSGKYFKQLFDSYSKTDYYQEILSECGYFGLYHTNCLNKRKK